MPLVAGVDTSTQSCKVVVCDADTGEEVRRGSAPHPDATEVDPRHWWTAYEAAVDRAGGLDDVAAVSVAGQQHGMVALDEGGDVIRPALLWHDTRSADAADQLVADLGGGDPSAGRRAWAEATGSVPLASFTVAKLRWLVDHEPEHARRVAVVALPHDWLTWRLRGASSLDDLVTDRSDASGTGYLDVGTGDYRRELLALATRDRLTDIQLPRVAGPSEQVGRVRGRSPRDLVVGPGCGDNAAAALGLGLSAGHTSVSVGTSGVVAAVSATPTHDATGLVAGFADAAGAWLPLACTLNASRVLDATARLLGVTHDQLSELALEGDSGADGLVLVPYLEGERTPNLPGATGSLHGLTLATMTPQHVARAAVEGVLCLLAEGLDAIRAQGVVVDDVTLVGGGSRSRAVQVLAPQVLGVSVTIPDSGEYVARGAARQAAWVLTGTPEPPDWSSSLRTECVPADPRPQVLARYREVRPWST